MTYELKEQLIVHVHSHNFKCGKDCPELDRIQGELGIPRELRGISIGDDGGMTFTAAVAEPVYDDIAE